MNANENLRSRIKDQLSESQTRLAGRGEERRRSMAPLSRRIELFERLARGWMDETVLPALRTLAQAFPNGRLLAEPPGIYRARVEFVRNDEFPVFAGAEVTIAHDPEIEHAWVWFSPSIIPILMDCAPQSSVELGLDAPDSERLSEFLGDKIVQFVADYLRVREPETFYQRENLVTDPVCGMTFRRMEAAASLEREGRRYFFCIEECRDRFAAEPERYLRPSSRTAAGTP